MNNNPKSVLTKFIELIYNSIPVQKPLFLSISTFQTFDSEILKSGTIVKNESNFENLANRKFDFVIGDLPFGMHLEEVDTVSKLRVNRNWKSILLSTRLLNEDGLGLFLCEPKLLISRIGKKFISDLENENCFLNCVFNPPPKLFYPETTFNPILVGFKKKQIKISLSQNLKKII